MKTGSPATTNRFLLPIAVITLLVFFALLADTSLPDKSQTFDEGAHITAGYSYWHTRNFQLNNQNGLLPQALVAIPLLFMDIDFPENNKEVSETSHLWKISDQFLYHNDNNMDSMLRNSRRMIILLGILTGVLVFAWSFQLWGKTGAFFSLGLYCLSPSILAHTRLATSDMTVTFAFLLSLYTFWLLLKSPSVKSTLLTGVAFALLATSKMSSVIIIPTAILTLLVLHFTPVSSPYKHTNSTKAYSLVHNIVAVTAAILIALLIINLVYSLDIGDTSLDSNLLSTLPSIISQPIQMASNWHLLPDRFLNGFAFVLHRTGFRMSFADGLYSTTGWWWYLPYTFLIKTPLTTLTAAGLSFLYLVKLLRNAKEDNNALGQLINLLPILTFMVVYVSFSVASHLSIGHRHLLPLYPPLFILCGILALHLTSFIRRALLILLMTVLTLETLTNHPHYLSFTNLASGGPEHGYHKLVDSSYDWGQDLPAVADWKQRNPHKPCYLSYFGTADPEYYKIECRRIHGFLELHENNNSVLLEPGWLIVSATMLQLGPISPQIMGPWNQQLEQQYLHLANDPNHANSRQLSLLRFGRLLHYLKKLDPDDRIAPSLLVYHINSDILKDALSSSASYNK